MARRRTTPEGMLARQVRDYLTLRGILWLRNNSGVLRDRNGRPVRFGTPGAADYLICLPGGRFCALELKAPGNRPTALQQAWLDTVTAAGGLAWYATTLDELRWLLAEAGHPER